MIKRFADSIDSYQCKNVRISLYGGELFQDKFDDQHIQKYYVFMDAIIAILQQRQYKYSFELVTNLVYHNIDRMIAFAQKYNCSIATSFDFVGRFKHQSQLQLWSDNVKQLLSRQIDFGVIIIGHKQNLIALQNNTFDIGFFANTGINIDIAEYDDVVHNNEFKPSTEDLINFVDTLKAKYSNIHLSMISNNSKCGLRVLDISSDHTILQRCDELALSELIVRKFDCLTCTHKQRCIINCPRKFLQNTLCPNKVLYDKYQ